MSFFPGAACYAGLTILTSINAIWVAIARVHINVAHALPELSLSLGLLILSLVLTRLKDPETGTIARNGSILVPPAVVERAILGCQAFFFLYFAWTTLRIFNHLTMSLALPHADEWLARADRSLFLDWNAYFAFVAGKPVLSWTLDHAYASLSYAIALVLFLLLVVLGRIRQTEFFAVTFFATAIICTSIGMFFPAEAAVAYMLERPELLDEFSTPPGLYHLHDLRTLRSGDPFGLNLANMPGLVTFPSFHTAAGIVVAWCLRRTLFYWPGVAYSVAMIASTPVFGGHYFIDVIAGTFVAFAVLAMVARFPRYSQLHAIPELPIPQAAQPAMSTLRMRP